MNISKHVIRMTASLVQLNESSSFFCVNSNEMNNLIIFFHFIKNFSSLLFSLNCAYFFLLHKMLKKITIYLHFFLLFFENLFSRNINKQLLLSHVFRYGWMNNLFCGIENSHGRKLSDHNNLHTISMKKDNFQKIRDFRNYFYLHSLSRNKQHDLYRENNPHIISSH